MCVIAICEKEKPTWQMLQQFNAANGDGFGIAWFKDDLAQYKKGMFLNEIFNFIQLLPLPFVVHARKASYGGKDLLLNHPFEITLESDLKLQGNSEKLLMHNGSLKDWEIYLSCAGIEKLLGETISDTKAVAKILAKNGNEEFLTKLDGYWVVMDGKTQKIKLFGNFKDDTEFPGMKFSNLLWKHHKVKYEYGNSSSTTSIKVKKSYTNKNEVVDPHNILTPEEMVSLDKPARRALRNKRRKEKNIPEPEFHPNAHVPDDKKRLVRIELPVSLKIEIENNHNYSENTKRILRPNVFIPLGTCFKKLFPFQPDIGPRLLTDRVTNDQEHYCG